MSHAREVEFLVLGVGGMGSAALYHLARLEKSPVGVERFSVGHDRGSSHGKSRAFRRLYSDDVYAKLATTALPLWREIEALSGETLLHLCGQLAFARAADTELERRMNVLESLNIPLERLTGAEACTRFPALSLPDNAVACFTPQAGFLDPDRAMRTHVALAKRFGATVEEGLEVLALDLSQERPIVETSHGQFRAEHVFVTPGPWATDILADLLLPLEVTRQEWFEFRPETRNPYLSGRLPVYADFDRDFYGFPLHGGTLKVASGHLGPSTSPQAVDRTPDLAQRDVLQSWLEELMPAAAFSYVSGATCMYTMAPETDFLLGPHPQHPRVYVAAGFSGHGFKFATLVGRILAELAVLGRTEYPLERFRLDRFA